MLHSLACNTVKFGCFPKRSLAVRSDLVKQHLCTALQAKNPPDWEGCPALEGSGVEGLNEQNTDQNGNKSMQYAEISLRYRKLDHRSHVIWINITCLKATERVIKQYRSMHNKKFQKFYTPHPSPQMLKYCPKSKLVAIKLGESQSSQTRHI